MRTQGKHRILAVAVLALVAGACGSASSPNSIPATSSSTSTTASTASTASTLAPAGYAEFPDIGIATVVPSEWVLEQELNRRGVGAMLYDAGDTAALVVLGRTSEIEDIEGSDVSEVALAVARQFAASWFEAGGETVSLEAAAVVGAEAATAQVRLAHADDTYTVTRVTVVQVGDEMIYVALGYQGEFPPERIEQGIEVLERIALLP